MPLCCVGVYAPHPFSLSLTERNYSSETIFEL